MFPMLAADTSTSGLSSAFSTAVSAVQTDAMGMITTALPVALAIGGAVLGIRLGWKFFRSMVK